MTAVLLCAASFLTGALFRCSLHRMVDRAIARLAVFGVDRESQ